MCGGGGEIFVLKKSFPSKSKKLIRQEYTHPGGPPETDYFLGWPYPLGVEKGPDPQRTHTSLEGVTIPGDYRCYSGVT